jgi:hypothetical protein
MSQVVSHSMESDPIHHHGIQCHQYRRYRCPNHRTAQQHHSRWSHRCLLPDASFPSMQPRHFPHAFPKLGWTDQEIHHIRHHVYVLTPPPTYDSLIMLDMGWAGGNAIAPQLFVAKWAPRYINTLYVHLGLYTAFVTTCAIMRLLLVRRNKVKDDAQRISDGTVANNNEHAFEVSRTCLSSAMELISRI